MAPQLAVILPLDAPLDPTSDQARRWLEEELAKGGYHPQPSLTERVLEWINRILSVTTSGGGPSFLVWVVLGIVLAALALVLVRVLRREVGPAGSRPTGVLDVPDLDAATLRERARAAAAREDWDDAVLDGVRAIARSAVERVLLDDAPGRTAHEVALALGTPFPADAEALMRAADAFDAVRYGHRAATRDVARAVLELDSRLAATRPLRPTAPAAG